MFVFVKNTNTDSLVSPSGTSLYVPLGWFWERVGEAEGTYVYLAVSLMMTFFLYLIVSVIEVAAWGDYMNANYAFARFYFSTIGYWGSTVFYALPVIFCIVQIALQGLLVFPGSWTIFHMIISFAMWLFTGLVHIIYIDNFIAFIDASDPSSECVCTAPEVLDLAEDADLETRLAWEFAIEQRRITCNIQCPPPEKDCSLTRMEGQSLVDYLEACRVLQAEIDAAKALAEAQEAEALDDEDEEEDEDLEDEESEGEGW